MRSAFSRLHTLCFAHLATLTILVLLWAGNAMADTNTDSKLETVILAGGCFWCVESDFDTVPGVAETVSGYTGGHTANPTYKQVSKGGTGHLESVRITFDPSIVSFGRLVYLFWRSVDPTDAGGQFCDRGESYTTAIFVMSDEQRQSAETSKASLADPEVFGHPVVTPIRMATDFWPAETYHQDYHNKKSLRYRYYRNSCGRDKRVRALWGDEAWAAK